MQRTKRKKEIFFVQFFFKKLQFPERDRARQFLFIELYSDEKNVTIEYMFHGPHVMDTPLCMYGQIFCYTANPKKYRVVTRIFGEYQNKENCSDPWRRIWSLVLV